ncbi:hypothetical protein [Streptomyces sp. NPDC096132]|uniref:hypothetical protein n=1 Tax=Streptomyces sp. NPDC096132 TaxID=3366075 RepID=UPI003811530B
MSYVPEEIISTLRMRLSGREEREFALQLEECLKFLYIRSIEGSGFIPLVDSVDDVWHELILQTEFYAKLCESLPGGNFIHHRTVAFGDHSRNIGKSEAVRDLLRWIPLYVSYFGPFREEIVDYWMIVRFVMEKFGMSLDEINELGHREGQAVNPF